MPNPEQGALTELLAAASAGDAAARDHFVEAVYAELHRLAARMMGGEHPGATLQATALANEAILHLFGPQPLQVNDRRHFLNIAAQQMRRILIDRARARNAGKRKGVRLSLEDAGQIPLERSGELVALDDALHSLAEVDPAAARVVELKFFGGYTDEEAAAIMEINPAKLRRDWAYAKAWLYDTMTR